MVFDLHIQGRKQLLDGDILAILITIVLQVSKFKIQYQYKLRYQPMLNQDIPFICLRLTLIFGYGVISPMDIFFTCKNSLVGGR